MGYLISVGGPEHCPAAKFSHKEAAEREHQDSDKAHHVAKCIAVFTSRRKSCLPLACDEEFHFFAHE